MSSHRKIIRDEIKTVLKTIIEGNNNGAGYSYINTIHNNCINDPMVAPENMKEFPSINLSLGKEECLNSRAGSQQGSNRQLLKNQCDVIFDCFLLDENQSDAQDNILADLQALFGENYSINSKVFNTMYKDSIPFGMKTNQPNCGITIIFTIWYRILSNNPNSQA